jgi:phosphoglycolate phosphatase
VTPARIVFDLDGTLIDSAPDIHALANRVLAGWGADPITMAQARDFIGNGAGVFVQRMRAARTIGDDQQSAMLAAFMGGYHDAVGLTVPYPGVAAALDRLVAQGHTLAVCTNKPAEPARAVLRHVGLLDLFAVVVGGDSLAVTKPDPAPLRAAFKALPPGVAVYVGDSGVDAETARAAGVPFLLFTEGYRKEPVAALPHAAAFGRWDNLPGLVDRILAE